MPKVKLADPNTHGHDGLYLSQKTPETGCRRMVKEIQASTKSWGGHSIWYLGTHPHTKKTTKMGDFCHRLVESRDLQKGGTSIFAKKGRCVTEHTPVTPIKGVLL